MNNDPEFVQFPRGAPIKAVVDRIDERGVGLFRLVECATHGTRPAYLTCVHITEREHIFILAEPTATEVGEMYCSVRPHRPEEVFPICAGCLREAGILPAA